MQIHHTTRVRMSEWFLSVMDSPRRRGRDTDGRARWRRRRDSRDATPSNGARDDDDAATATGGATAARARERGGRWMG